MNKLQEIFEWKRQEVEAANLALPLSRLKELALECEPTRGFLKALKNGGHEVSLIAEVKKASPSQGTIRNNFDPAETALAYRNAGADCLSVLTDEKFFGGKSEYIAICKNASGLPVLRKDFIYDPYQLYESRALGADAVLLIVAMLEPTQISELRLEAIGLNLDVLVEVHSEAEAEIALALSADLVGINNRDLGTFLTDLSVTERVTPILKGKCHIVSESALSSKNDIRRVQSAGANSVLIGTAFCSSTDIEGRVREVMNWQ